MWNLTSNGLCTPFTLIGGQKRGLGMGQFNTVRIEANKSFKNPNFINNELTNNSFDKYDVKTVSAVGNSCNILDTIKEKQPGLIERSEPKMCNGRLPGKNSRRRRRRKNSGGKNKNNIKCIIAGDMDLEEDLNVTESSVDISFSPQSLHLADFFDEKLDVIEAPEATQTFTLSITPPSRCAKFRERQVSLCESEDSFVVFESASNDELDLTDTSESEEETTDDEEEEESEFDSSTSVIPNKRVRFAQDLCEVHPMIQWAYAYQAARKGPWETYARDRERFKTRIYRTEQILKPIFDTRHRDDIFKQRFM